jgi:hypothetical protein
VDAKRPGAVKLVERYILPRIDSFLNGLAVLTSLKSFSCQPGLDGAGLAVAIANQYALLLGFLPDAELLYSTFALGISSFRRGHSLRAFRPGRLSWRSGGCIRGCRRFFRNCPGLCHHPPCHALHLLRHFWHVAFSREGESLMGMYEKLTSKKNKEEMSDVP